MGRGPRAFRDAVRSVRIDHRIERLAELDQPVDQLLGALGVNVVVARAVNDHQLALQAFGEAGYVQGDEWWTFTVPRAGGS